MGDSSDFVVVDYGMLIDAAVRYEGVLASLEAAQVRWLPAGVDQTGDSYVSAALDNAAAVLDLGFALLKERVAQLQASATAVRESFEQTDQQLVKEVVEDAFCTRRTPTPPPAPGPTGAPWSPEPLIIVPADG